jgi:prepilin-type N-terminal cleavage/methylation domain-containing protein/prepilin-type processing-associated H-X9-DG protein
MMSHQVLHQPMTPIARRRRRAFTLVELLVVIGIIALLVGILLPTLGSARRQAASVKCLASLREIGNAFAIYAVEQRGYWPVAVHAEGSTPGLMPPGSPVGANERRWPDLIAKYVSSNKNVTNADSITAIRRSSVIWGCPEWTKTQEFNENLFADKVRVGYGMQYYPTYFQDGKADDLAYVRAGTATGQRIPGVLGAYVKAAVWGRKGAQRGVIIDSITHIVQTPQQGGSGVVQFTSNFRWFPFDYNGTGSLDPTNMFYVDARRHAKPNTTKKQTYGNVRGMNMLFADGHAQPVSVKEAWDAIHNPGQNRTGN